MADDPTQLTFNAYAKLPGSGVGLKISRYEAPSAVQFPTTPRRHSPTYRVYRLRRGHYPHTCFRHQHPGRRAAQCRLLREEPPAGIPAQHLSKPGKPSFNVIGEIRAANFRKRIILVGGISTLGCRFQRARRQGRLRCVHAMEVLHLIRRMGYRQNGRSAAFVHERGNSMQGRPPTWKWSDDRGVPCGETIESDRAALLEGWSPPTTNEAGVQRQVPESRRMAASDWNLTLTEPPNEGVEIDISGLKATRKGCCFSIEPDSAASLRLSFHTPIELVWMWSINENPELKPPPS